ncbi:CapA family protein [Brevibacillus fluminis]|uniref:CapA family protein n=1 Tax=Brevibacillus fluminis TaxID=511487 RepID=A0A3M8DV66_9BACL|nr:CapA family protein [Brevibacillus fluminis]RNB91261.1 CapA family protein [Brevibacillus fluminis]
MDQTRSERIATMRREQKRNRRQNAFRPRKISLLAGGILLACLAVAGILFVGKAYLEGLLDKSPPVEQSTNITTPVEKPATVKLTFIGDLIFTGHVETRLKEQGYDFPYAYVKDLFTDDDYTIGNLETPVTKRGMPAANKEFVYKSPPEAIPALKAAGIDLVNLANNHSMDQGVDGLLDTFDALTQNNIAYMGAGPDDDRAYAPIIVERNGIKMAFFGFSRVIPEVSWYAGKNMPGVASVYDPARAVAAIRAAKEHADLVIVIPHWGKEREDLPVEHQTTLARAFIDAGANLIVGGHPHVLQGFESYRDKWIAYSTGNFIFTRASEPRTWETMVLQATCTKAGTCSLTMLPHHAELGQAVPMNAENAQKLRQRIQSISKDVRIDADGSIHPSTE